MAEKRTLLEYLSKYEATGMSREIIASATDYRARVDKPNKMLELVVDFPRVYRKVDIRRVEAEIKSAYALNYVHIVTHYGVELWTKEYVDDMLLELQFRGVVARGFFNDYVVEVDDQNKHITVKIGFGNGGIELMYSDNTHIVASKILKEEFDIEYSVDIITDDALEKERQEKARKLHERLDKNMPRAMASSTPRATVHKKTVGITRISDTAIRSGYLQFDYSEPAPIYGEQFAIGEPTPLYEIGVPERTLRTLMGKAFFPKSKDISKGKKTVINFCITDNESSVPCKVVLDAADGRKLLETLSGEPAIVLRGNVEADTYTNTNEFVPLAIMQISCAPVRKDRAEKKRVELHMHTQLSQMDAIIEPKKILKLAKSWGHTALAVTDHANVQAFPPMMEALDKMTPKGGQPPLKVIYGVEAYLVDDSAKAVFGNRECKFAEDEFVVFDIETTGKSCVMDKIIEIGAVICKGNEILDRFDTFVNPNTAIPEEITELTSITDEMVEGAPFIKEALKSFLDFCGERPLVAHNAAFDTGFIRTACAECEYEFKNTYIDTLAISRFVNTDLKKHKLDILQKYFGLEDFHHHRACDDAEVTAKIFYKMCQKLKEDGILDTASMSRTMADKTDPRQIKDVYHVILLVKTEAGLKNLYKIVSKSYVDYFYRVARVPKTLLDQYREGIIVGSACEAGELYTAVREGKNDEELKEIASYYDYLEIQPLCNNAFMLDRNERASMKSVSDYSAPGFEKIRELNRKIVRLGEELDKPVCATCDAHFINPEDDIYRQVLIHEKFKEDIGFDSGLYFRTTEEMLEEFSYLGEEKAYEVVVENTNKIADMISSEILPIPRGSYTPKIEGAPEELQERCWKRAREWYGFEGKLPDVVENRLNRELKPIIENGFAVLYIIAQKLIANSESKGYLVGSRGSVGSSFVATMAGVSEVNPLPPHYRCPKCKHSEFFLNGEVGSGFDLPDKDCPVCGTKYICDGHEIPFETFLGFHGEKSPDIDLNFSGDVQADAHKYCEVLFGAENVFRAGTLGSLADKTAELIVNKYQEATGKNLNRAEVQRLVEGCIGAKKTTGQHPGGIVVIPHENEIYDFTPIQHPADKAGSDIITTHFDFNHLHDTILKLDCLGHDVPTKYVYMERFSGVKIADVPMNDRKVYDLLLSTEPLGVTPEDIDSLTGTFGLPELGTKFVRQMLVEAKPTTFSDLLQISGLSHGTGVWLGNARDLITNGTCTIKECIGTRDDIMVYLSHAGLEPGDAFTIMETVRKKNKFLNEEQIGKMREKGVPEWYIDSCNKIEYMFPKAHAVAYDISAIRLGWYKIYHPLAFYGAMFTVAPKGFDAEIAIKGKEYVKEQIRQITEKGNSATQKEKSMIPIWQLVVEFYARGLEFLPVDIHKSKAREFTPEDGKLRIPFGVLPELGEKAAESIEDVMQNGGGVLSVEELRERAQISKKHIEILKRNGALDGLGETAQLSFGDLGMFGESSTPEKPSAKPTSKKTDGTSPNGDGSDQISFF